MLEQNFRYQLGVQEWTRLSKVFDHGNCPAEPTEATSQSCVPWIQELAPLAVELASDCAVVSRTKQQSTWRTRVCLVFIASALLKFFKCWCPCPRHHLQSVYWIVRCFLAGQSYLGWSNKLYTRFLKLAKFHRLVACFALHGAGFRNARLFRHGRKQTRQILLFSEKLDQRSPCPKQTFEGHGSPNAAGTGEQRSKILSASLPGSFYAVSAKRKYMVAKAQEWVSWKSVKKHAAPKRWFHSDMAVLLLSRFAHRYTMPIPTVHDSYSGPNSHGYVEEESDEKDRCRSAKKRKSTQMHLRKPKPALCKMCGTFFGREWVYNI